MNPPRALHARLALCAAAALFAGCSVLAPQPDRTRFFVLTASAPPAEAVSPSPGALALGLGPIDLPSYLGHLEVVTRAAPNRIDLSPSDRWAESFDDNVREVLTRDLGARLPGAHIVSFPWYPTTPLDYEIAVRFERFERVGANSTELDAHWTIRDGKTRRTLATRAARFATAVPDGAMESAAAALSADLAGLAGQIATTVAQLNQARAAHSGG